MRPQSDCTVQTFGAGENYVSTPKSNATPRCPSLAVYGTRNPTGLASGITPSIMRGPRELVTGGELLFSRGKVARENSIASCMARSCMAAGWALLTRGSSVQAAQRQSDGDIASVSDATTAAVATGLSRPASPAGAPEPEPEPEQEQEQEQDLEQ